PLQHDRDVVDLLPGADGDALRLARVRGAGEIRRRVRGAILAGGGVARVLAPPGGAQVVLPRRDAEEAELADVVGRRLSAGGDELPPSLYELIPLKSDRDLRRGFAVLVDDPSGDHAAARQREVETLDRLVIEDLQRLRRVGRTILAVRQADVASLRCG